MASFSGGEKLKAKLEELAKKVSTPGTLRVGFLGNATYPDGTSVALVATINEYGAPSRGQPPRPYFRRMIAAKSPGWGKSLENLLKSTDYDTEQSLKLMGTGIKQQLQASIRELVSPPLAASTVAAKKFDKPLINTGHMLNSVDFEVKE